MRRNASKPPRRALWLVVLAATLGLLVVSALGVVVQTRLQARHHRSTRSRRRRPPQSYSGERVPFVRGDGNVEVDHVVALSDAWQKGAQQWTVEQRTAFANDPLNLVVTTRVLNQKGAGDAATWLPPNRAYRCGYVARQAAVKHRYGVWVTWAERTAMLGILEGCPDEPAPAGDERPTATRQ